MSHHQAQYGRKFTDSDVSFSSNEGLTERLSRIVTYSMAWGYYDDGATPYDMSELLTDTALIKGEKEIGDDEGWALRVSIILLTLQLHQISK